MSVLKKTNTFNGTTSYPSEWSWKQVVEEYWEDNYLTTNESTIIVKSYMGRVRSRAYFGGKANLSITCDGQTKNVNQKVFTYPTYINAKKWYLMQEETFVVQHNSNGKKTISVSSSMTTSQFSPDSGSASGNLELTPIPRTTQCPNLDGYIESSIPISLNSASNSFKHRLYYSYGNKTGYYPSSTTFFSSSGNLDLDTSFYNETPNKSGTGSLTLYTYDSDGVQIGTSTGTLTVRCDENKCKPTISATIIDINTTTIALTGNNNKIIKNYSNAQITYTINARNNATLSSKKVNNSNLGDSPFVINNVNTNIFNIIALDSRGFSSALTITKTLIPYVPLNFTFNVLRTSGIGSEIKINFKGNYFNGNFGVETNTLELFWKYKENNGDIIDGGNFVLNQDYKISNNQFYSGNGTNMSNIILSSTLFNYQNTYTIYLYGKDKLSGNIYKIQEITRGLPVANWKRIDNDNIFNINGIFSQNNISLLDYCHPIGSLYFSINATEPSTLFGGTWQRIKDVFIFCAGNMYNAGDRGGEANVTLGINQLPSHNHSASSSYSGADFYIRHGKSAGTDIITGGFNTSVEAGTGPSWGNGISTEKYQHNIDKVNISGTVSTTIGNTGNGQAHNNMPPFLTYYCWQRTA